MFFLFLPLSCRINDEWWLAAKDGGAKKRVFTKAGDAIKKKREGRNLFPSPPPVRSFSLTLRSPPHSLYLLNPLPPPREVRASAALAFLRGTDRCEGLSARDLSAASARLRSASSFRESIQPVMDR